jgi:hypothetical protein
MGVKTVRSLDQARYVATEEPPAQQKPDQSTSSASLNPHPGATTSLQSWNAFIDKAIAISAEQNQGSAAISRSCKLDWTAAIALPPTVSRPRPPERPAACSALRRRSSNEAVGSGYFVRGERSFHLEPVRPAIFAGRSRETATTSCSVTLITQSARATAGVT